MGLLVQKLIPNPPPSNPRNRSQSIRLKQISNKGKQVLLINIKVNLLHICYKRIIQLTRFINYYNLSLGFIQMETQELKDYIQIKNVTGFNSKLKNALFLNPFASEKEKDRDSIVKLIYLAANTIVTSALTSFDKDKKRSIIQTLPNSKGVNCITQSPSKRYLAWAQQLPEGPIVTILDLQKNKKRYLNAKPENHKFISLAFNGSENSEPKSLIGLTTGVDTYLVHYNNCLGDKWKMQYTKINQDKEQKQKQKFYNAFFFNNKQDDFVVVNGKGCVKTYKLSSQNVPKQKDSPFVRKNIQESQYNFFSYAIVKNQLILGTQKGHIFHLSQGCQFKSILQSSPCYSQTIQSTPSIQVMISFSKGFIIGSIDGRVMVYQKQDGKKQFAKQTKRFHIKDAKAKITSLILTGKQQNLLVGLDNNQIFKIPFSDKSYDQSEKYDHAVQSFHSQGITGLDVCLRKSLVATCSTDKTIRIWNTQNNSFSLDICTQFSEQKAIGLTFHPSGLHIIVAFTDKIRIFNIFQNDLIYFKQIAQKNCSDIKFSNGGQYFGILSSSAIWIYRFYTGQQVYSKNTTYHNQTMFWEEDDQGLFIGTVEGVLNYVRLQQPIFEMQIFKQGKLHINSLLSIFSQVTQKQNVYHQRTILIAGSFSNTTPAQQKGIYKIVMAPRTQKDKDRIQLPRDASRYIISKPQFICTNKNISKIGLLHSGKVFMYCTNQKNQPGTIRFVRYPFSGSIVEVQAHLMGITRLKISFDDSMIYTGSEEGAIVAYQIKSHDLKVKLEPHDFTQEFLIAKSKYIQKRKTLQELKKRNNQKSQQKLRQQNQIAMANEQEKEKISGFIRSSQQEYEMSINKQWKQLQNNKIEHQKKMQILKEKHQRKKQTVAKDYQQKIRLQNQRLQQLKKTKDIRNRDHHDKKNKMQTKFQELKEQKQRDYKQHLKLQIKKVEQLQKIYHANQNQFQSQQQKAQAQAQKEIEERNQKYEDQKRELEAQNTSAQAQNQAKRQQHDNQKEKLQQQKLHLKQVKQNIKKTQQRHEQLLQTKQSHVKEIEQRQKTIKDKMTRIHQLRKKTQQLEKFKFVLDYKIKQLTRNVGPKEEQITKMNEQIDNMQSQIKHFLKINKNMKLIVKDLRLKKAGMQKQIQEQNKQQAGNIQYIKSFQYDLSEFYPKSKILDEQKELKNRIVELFRKYVQADQTKKKKADSVDKQQQFFKERAHLQTTVKGLKDKFDKNFEVNKKDNKRMITQNEDLIYQLNDLKRQQRHLRWQSQKVERQAHIEEQLPTLQKQIGQMQSLLSQLKAELQRKQEQYHNQG